MAKRINQNRHTTPRGAKIQQDIFSDKDMTKLTSQMIMKPKIRNDEMLNPADPYSPNGFFAKLGRSPVDQSSKERVSKIKDAEQLEDFNKVNKKGSYIESSSPINEGFTSIPRLMGLLGQYVTPPSKVTLADMYEATLDATLGSIIQVGKSLIISKLGSYYHEDKKINQVVTSCFDKLNTTELHYRGLDFLIYGFTVGETSWGTTKDHYNIIDRITFAPPTNIEFMIDDYGRMQAALQPNLVANQYGIFPGQPKDLPESVFAIRELVPSVLPYILVGREDLFYCAYDSTFTPYGTSPMRRAYKFYQMKGLALELLMAALSRNGAPALAVYYQKDMIKNELQLKEFRDNIDGLTIGNTLYLPGKKGEAYDVEAIRLDSSNIPFFMNFVDYCDNMMIRSLGFPSEILMGGGGSFASGTVQKETYEDMLQLYVDRYSEALMTQIVKPVIEANFSASLIKKVGYGEFIPKLRHSNITEKLTQFEIGVNTGLIDPTNKEDVDIYRRAIGLPAIKGKKLPVDNAISTQAVNKEKIDKPYTKQNGKPFSSEEQVK